MAAMTRVRADLTTRAPSDLHVEYYSARASAGFMITECSAVSPEGDGYPGEANIYSDEQVEGWKKVVDAVHAKGGVIFIQLYHSGRINHPDQIDGVQPICSSP